MYKKNAAGWRKHLDFIIIDIFCLHIALVIAYAIRHGHWNLYADKSYLSIAVVMTIMDVLIAIMFSSFKNVLKRGEFKEYLAALKHVCMVECSVFCYLFFVQESSLYSRIVFYIFPLFYLLLTICARYLRKKQLKGKLRWAEAKSLLLVTTIEWAPTVIDNIQNWQYGQYSLRGLVILDEDFKGKVVEGIPVISGKEKITNYICREWADAVMICVPPEHYPAEMVQDFQKMGIVVHHVIARKSAESDCTQQVERIGTYTVLTTGIRNITGTQLFIKRTMDIVGGLVGCILTIFLTLVIGPAIYMKSPGPIFFVQTRVGKNGKLFKIYKFRTMYPDAEQRKAELQAQNRVPDGRMFKLDFDPRIIGNERDENGIVKTGIGSFLRESSLDEFPQFFNVLKGDMSLVGTRPPTKDEWEKYELHHRARLAIKPGLTGMWQVSGRSEITDFEEVVKLDTKYINEWSLGMDLKILVKTLLVVIGKRGAR